MTCTSPPTSIARAKRFAWHLREVIGGDPTRFRRVVFNEITRKAIRDAFASPGEIDQNRVNAQQARRFLDRVVGFEVSPLLWAKVARGLSAGRVQSVAVRLVVEREREIRAFEPEEYWEVFADLKREGEDAVCRFQVMKQAGETFRAPQPDGSRCSGRGAHWRDVPCRPGGEQAGDGEAAGALHHVHAAAGGVLAARFRRSQDDGARPAPL